jgi:hypothetical protein
MKSSKKLPFRSTDWKAKEARVREAAAFLKPIIPHNWNIRPAWGREEKKSFKPNALNIKVWFVEWEEEADFLGQVHGPLRFLPVGLWASISPASRRASKEFPHAFLSQIELWLSPLWNLDRQGTLVHEMAHIAAVRAHARRSGRKDRSIVGQNFEKKIHGPLFCKAFQRMIIRTEKAYGKEKAKAMRLDLEYFQKRGGEKGCVQQPAVTRSSLVTK